MPSLACRRWSCDLGCRVALGLVELLCCWSNYCCVQTPAGHLSSATTRMRPPGKPGRQTGGLGDPLQQLTEAGDERPGGGGGGGRGKQEQMFDPSPDCLARGRSQRRWQRARADISEVQTQLATRGLSEGSGVGNGASFRRLFCCLFSVSSGFPEHVPPASQRHDNTSTSVYVLTRGLYELPHPCFLRGSHVLTADRNYVPTASLDPDSYAGYSILVQHPAHMKGLSAVCLCSH